MNPLVPPREGSCLCVDAKSIEPTFIEDEKDAADKEEDVGGRVTGPRAVVAAEMKGEVDCDGNRDGKPAELAEPVWCIERAPVLDIAVDS